MMGPRIFRPEVVRWGQSGPQLRAERRWVRVMSVRVERGPRGMWRFMMIALSWRREIVTFVSFICIYFDGSKLGPLL